MDKKGIGLLLILGVAVFNLSWGSTTTAAPMETKPTFDGSAFDGPYIGLQGGFLYALFEHTSTSSLLVQREEIFHATELKFFDVPTNDSASNISGDIGGKIGYGHAYKRLYLGLEANGDYSDAHINAHSIPSNPAADIYSTTTYTGKVVGGYGLDLRPGFLITPTFMLYLKGGVQWTNLTGSSTIAFAAIPTITDQFYGISSGISGNVVGWQAGIGVEKRSGKRWGFRAEYLFTDYDGRSRTNTIPITGVKLLSPSTVSNSFSLRPLTNSLLVGIDFYV